MRLRNLGMGSDDSHEVESYLKNECEISPVQRAQMVPRASMPEAGEVIYLSFLFELSSFYFAGMFEFPF
jgi:hypothetical protein